VILAASLLASSLVVLADDRPAELPPHAIVAAWPRVAGYAAFGAGRRISYELYVEPSRSALYAITRYRVSSSSGARNEVLIWNSRPGTHEPLHCFERVAQAPTVAGGAVKWIWVAVPHDTAPYREAMLTAIHVYGAYQAMLWRAADAETAAAAAAARDK
jgi:hypothetical protein